MVRGRVRDLFKPFRYPLQALIELFPGKGKVAATIRATLIVYPMGTPELSCREKMAGRKAQIVFAKNQWYLVMTCADGQKRSFGEGTRIEYGPSTTAAV